MKKEGHLDFFLLSCDLGTQYGFNTAVFLII